MHSPKFCHISNLLFSVCQAEHIPCMEQQLYMPGNALIKFLLVLVLEYLLFFIITSCFSFYFYILLGIIPNNNYTVIYSSCQDKRRKSSLISTFSAFCTMKIFMIFMLSLKTQMLFFSKLQKSSVCIALNAFVDALSLIMSFSGDVPTKFHMPFNKIVLIFTLRVYFSI